MRWVVARPHRVEVVRLHQLDVGAHHVLADRAAGVRVELVAVDAAQQDAPPVDGQQPVLDGDAPEADLQPHALAGGRQRRVVESRELGAPRRDARELDGRPARYVDRELRNRQAPWRVDPQPARSGHVVVVGVHEHVLDRLGRAPQEHDLAEDPGQPPHVLVFEIRTRRPLVHAHREHVAPAPQEVAGVELDREPAAARGAEQRAVQPRLQRRVDALEAQHRRAFELAVEGPAVVAGRVGVGNVGRLDRERIVDVRVRRRAVAAQLPVRRDVEPVPARVVVVRGGEGPRRPRRTARAGTPTRRRAPAAARPTAGTRVPRRLRCRTRMLRVRAGRPFARS